MYDELIGELYLTASTALSKSKRELLEKAADAIEELQQQVEHYHGCMNDWFETAQEYKAAVPKWIPVTERLPEDDIVCILTNGISDAIGYRGKVFGWHLIWTDYVVESEVTHWMPLPEPPMEET